jgi:hypothetical protein
MPRAFSLLAAFASPVFLCAAIAGWLFEVWPANPLTLGAAAFLVMGGPILGIVHVVTTDTSDDAEEEAPTAVLPAPAPASAPEPIIVTAKADAARRFTNWRDTPNDALTQRERARRANRYVRS